MLSRIVYRCKQFYYALFSVYSKNDEKFAGLYLKPQELALFNQLPGFEKKHSVVVARKMLAMSRLHPELDPNKLARIGLLHDIGKVLEHNSITTKALLVILRFFFPCLYETLAERGRTNPRFRRIYLYKYHGQLGAEMLGKLGVAQDILTAVRKHDSKVEPPAKGDPLELALLQKSDSTL
ncbi:MAG: HDIG domain-containing metalloprotein [Candidatus Margulisiibacteriota bacterium]|jgi:putative nucleotidyltransferase with HDIG domain